MSSGLKNRLLTTLIGVPLIICILVFLPQLNYLVFSIVTFSAVLLGSAEMEKLLFGKKTFLSFLPVLFPLVTYLELLLFPSVHISGFIIPFILLILFALQIFTGAEDNFKSSVSILSKQVLMMFYPGFLMTYVIKLLAMNDNAGILLLYMLIMVFSNDIFAYVFGKLFGKSTKGILKASPNKSIVGFAGGLLCCILFSYLFNIVAGLNLETQQTILMGLLVSLCANIGDLFESVLKRSAISRVISICCF